MTASLRLELFPADLDTAISFYETLGFTLAKREGTYAYLTLDDVRLGLVESPAADAALRAVPTGAEVVIEVDDVRAFRERLVSAGLELDADLREQPWGLTDFRLSDPDGYYLRITGR